MTPARIISRAWLALARAAGVVLRAELLQIKVRRFLLAAGGKR